MPPHADFANFKGFSDISHRIWVGAASIILIYLGSAADFALNPENHWLFYTNSLPSDPQRRFVQTLAYNQKLILATPEEMRKLGEHIRQIHTRVEEKRDGDQGGHPKISNTAFVQVGDMLIDYGIRAFEYLHRKLSPMEREQYFQDMRTMMQMMHVDHPDHNYSEFLARRAKSVEEDLQNNQFTDQLFKAYLDDLGWFKYWIMRNFMAYFVNPTVAHKLKLRKNILWWLPYHLYPWLHSRFLFHRLFRFLVKPEPARVLLNLERSGVAKVRAMTDVG